MEQVGAQARHRAPALHDPAEQYLRGGMLLIVAFGLTAAAIHEAYLVRAWFWMITFVLLEAGVTSLYFMCVSWWLDNIRQLAD